MLNDWKAEFYSVPASAVPFTGLVSHALLKWIGLRQDNLSKHDLFANYGRLPFRISDGQEDMIVNASSCSLCHAFHRKTAPYDAWQSCKLCPLFKINNGPCSAPFASLFVDAIRSRAGLEKMIDTLILTEKHFQANLHTYARQVNLTYGVEHHVALSSYLVESTGDSGTEVKPETRSVGVPCGQPNTRSNELNFFD